jgi:protein-tyrosine-phosphatase
VIARLLQRELENKVDVEGRRWEVASAGVRLGAVPLDSHTVTAARAVGIDITGHRPRLLTGELLDAESPDLVVAAAREHVRAVIGLDSALWTRAFTLRDLARRSAAGADRYTPPTVEAWLRSLGTGRNAASTIGDDDHDDLADPYGRPGDEHERMVTTVEALVRQIVRTGPWVTVTSPTGHTASADH